jgi:hypothetical protein
MNTLDEARNVLRNGGGMVDLAKAIGFLISDPASSVEDLQLGLQYGGFIAEQAELAIERRARSYPKNGDAANQTPIGTRHTDNATR